MRKAIREQERRKVETCRRNIARCAVLGPRLAAATATIQRGVDMLGQLVRDTAVVR